MDNPLKIKVLSIVLDCKDPRELADFYAALLGGIKRDENPEWIWVSLPQELPSLLFQRTDDYEAPVWPDEPEKQKQMIHIDFAVNDINAAIEHALHCGAKISPVQFSEHWKVMIDPAGHPFCLCQKDI